MNSTQNTQHFTLICGLTQRQQRLCCDWPSCHTWTAARAMITWSWGCARDLVVILDGKI